MSLFYTYKLFQHISAVNDSLKTDRSHYRLVTVTEKDKQVFRQTNYNHYINVILTVFMGLPNSKLGKTVIAMAHTKVLLPFVVLPYK